jgi:hypothetical protein
MRWIRRVLWLAPWGCWVALGVGLYRQLPRQLGREIAVLPLKEDEHSAGFIDGREVLVTESGLFEKTVFRLWNPRTGQLVQTLDKASLCVKQGFAIFHQDDPFIKEVLDLTNGDRKTIRMFPSFRFHPSKPWMMAKDEIAPHVYRFLAVDLSTGKCRTFGPTWKEPEEYRGASFVSDTEFLVSIMTRIGPIDRDADSSPKYKVRREYWTVDGMAAPPIMLEDDDSRGSDLRHDRMLVLRSEGYPSNAYVINHRTNAMILDLQAVNDTKDGIKRGTGLPRLSLDGRKLVSGNGVIWDVDSRLEVWQPRKHERVREVDPDRHILRCVEWWDDLFDPPPGVKRLVTDSIREFETGAFRYRTWEHPSLSDISSDGRLGIIENRVYEMPPRVNWLLLAICQSILALPLILLWAVLRWRRIRRTRLALSLSVNHPVSRPPL